MATDFMASRVRFLNSALICFLCISCHTPEHQSIELTLFNAKDLWLENRNGMLFQDNMPFSGKMYALYPHSNDTMKITGYYQGKEHGTWKVFFPNRQLQELRYFNQGMKIKTLKRWWANGQIQLACTFKNGEYDQAFHEWNINGQLIKTMHYNQGFEEGSQKLFYDTGKIRSNYVMKNGKRIGLLGTKNCINVSDSIFKK